MNVSRQRASVRRVREKVNFRKQQADVVREMFTPGEHKKIIISVTDNGVGIKTAD